VEIAGLDAGWGQVCAFFFSSFILQTTSAVQIECRTSLISGSKTVAVQMHDYLPTSFL
jgi:hypothetical protein